MSDAKDTGISHIDDARIANVDAIRYVDSNSNSNSNSKKDVSDADADAVSHIDLNHNEDARLKNPLAGISRAQLIKDVERFAEEKHLTHVLPDLTKGAILAQNPTEYESLDVLDEHDRAVIKHEYTHKWSHPLTLYLTIIVCSIGAATQGWDQTGSNGANLSFPQEFGIPTDMDNPHAARNQWLVGLVNSAPYIGCAICGCWLSDPLNNWFGRRGTIFITGIILLATPIGSAFTHSWETLFVVRLILGIGMGAKGSTVPIFAAENSPPQIRGALVMSWQLWTAFGIFLGNAANVIVKDAGAIAWRLQIGSAFIPAVPLVIGIFFCPESPRWLMKKNRYAKAYKSLLRLRHDKLQAARDIYYIHVQLEEERKIARGGSYFARFAELWTIPRVRRGTIAASTVMLAQQMCGINIIAFYSSTVFQDATGSATKALYASLGFGAVNFVFAFPALFTIDTFGRRSLLLATFPQMAWTLLAAGLCFLITPDQQSNPARIGLIGFFIYLFAAFYSPGEGPVPFTYSAEVFPLAQREMGMAWAVTVTLGFAAVLTITYPRMAAVMTITGAFGFYAGLNVTAFVLIFLFVPETKQRSLEELDQVFSVPTRKFIHYNVTQALPYWFKRWILWDKTAHLEPLFHEASAHHKSSELESASSRDEKA